MGNIVTIVIGVVLIVGGLSGFVLRGTDSPAALIAIGAAVIVWGTFRLIKDRNKK
jgi:uncharacterized membrane protein HdeD (DUF308 family)